MYRQKQLRTLNNQPNYLEKLIEILNNAGILVLRN